jgi:hypothetical protein
MHLVQHSLMLRLGTDPSSGPSKLVVRIQVQRVADSS